MNNFVSLSNRSASWSLFGFLLPTYLGFGVESHRFRTLRSAKVAARHAGHDGSISFPIRGLLSRSAADSRSSRLEIKKSETIQIAVLQKRNPLNNFIKSRKRYEKVEGELADLLAPRKRARASRLKTKKKRLRLASLLLKNNEPRPVTGLAIP